MRALQLWFTSREKNQRPKYSRKWFEPKRHDNKSGRVLSSDGRNGGPVTEQTVFLYCGDFTKPESLANLAYRSL